MSPELLWTMLHWPGPIVVDRVEGDWVVVEIGPSRTLDLPLAWFPAPPREGERLRLPSPPLSPSVADAAAPAPPGAPPPTPPSGTP